MNHPPARSPANENSSAVVDVDLDGARVDSAIARLFELPTAVARRFCEAGRVRVVAGPNASPSARGKKAKKGDRVGAGDLVVVEGGDAWFVTAGAPVLDVIARVGEYVVVNKPAFIACHPLIPGEGGTVADGIAAVDAAALAASVDAREAGLLHRLDSKTSGCLAYARSRDAWHEGRAALEAPGAEKEYLAIVHHVVEAAFDIDAPIGHAGRLMKIDPEGRPARTTVTPVSTSTSVAPVSLVRLLLGGGRRHQLRVHLAGRGYPLVGDVDYDGTVVHDAFADGFCLHAARLAFGAVSASAPLPPRFVAAASALGLVLPGRR